MSAGRRRRQIRGAADILAALDRGETLQRIVVRGEAPGLEALLARAARGGVPVTPVGDAQFTRLAPRGSAVDALALLGPPKAETAEDALRAPGAAWLLCGVEYPGNTGFAIRTAEVSGSAAVFVDAPFDRAGRREALRAAMRADRFMPVFWREAQDVLDAATRAGRRLVAIEDVGREAPWELDLTGPVLFLVGGESRGIPEAALARCDASVRLPMEGFVRSYNLQAAVAAIAYERLRQLGRSSE